VRAHGAAADSLVDQRVVEQYETERRH
jgi:hypothetical protein